MKFGENLKRFRKSNNLSQEDLAQKVNVSRQSVSKWETGDAYPEMNNLLELCKIFHCHINNLVNDSIIDIDSLDEDIKIKVVKFKQEQQKKVKLLSKVIMVIARIGEILCKISIPLIIISMLFLSYVINNTNVSDNKIEFSGFNLGVSMVEEKDTILIKFKDTILAKEDNVDEIARIKNVFNNNSKMVIIGYVTVGLLFLMGTVILIILILKHLRNLFNNIYIGDTPFTLENVNHIKKMAYYMIAIIIFNNTIIIVFELIMNLDLDLGFEMFDLIEILFLFSMSYIFKYGYEIQLDSNGKMYGEKDE